MATNKISDGNTATFTATGDHSSGDAVMYGATFGVVQEDATTGNPVTLALCGVFTLPKATGQAWTEGQKLYWSSGSSEVTSTASGNTAIGAAMAAAATGDVTGAVRLSGAHN